MEGEEGEEDFAIGAGYLERLLLHAQRSNRVGKLSERVWLSMAEWRERSAGKCA